MTGVLDDLRHGVRALARAPGFCALAVATLALGIGATSAMFSVVYGVLFRPLPFSAPEALVRVWQTTAGNGQRGSFSPAAFLDVQREARSLHAVAGYTNVRAAIAADADPVRLVGLEVTANFFDVLGATAALGRVFSATEDRPGAALVVLADGAWRQVFGADPGVIGRTVRIDGQPYQVAGVMPRDFAYPDAARFWRLAPLVVPTSPMQVDGDLLAQRGLGYMDVLARMAPDVTPSEAAADLRVLAAELGTRYPDSDAGRGFEVEPVYTTLVGGVRSSLLVLFAAVGAVLLIACTNIASLLLARAVGRRRELAVRRALGASPWRLGRQLLVESVVLAIAGGALGVVVASWSLDGLRAVLPSSIPRLAAIRLDATAVAFAAGVSLLVGLLFGTAPAWTSALSASFDALRDGGRTSTGGRHYLRRILVAGQVALASVLLAAAGVLGASLVRLQRVDVGFQPEGVVTQQIVLPQSRYDRAAQARFYQSVTERLATDPRVVAAGTVFPAPFVSSQAAASIRLDRPLAGDPPDREYTVRLGSVTPGFFAAMGIPLLAGRTFVPTDFPTTAQSVIVNQAFATRLLGGGDVLGRTLQFDGPYSVVGVVADARAARVDQAAEPIAYLPHTHLTLPFVRLVVRGAAGDVATREAIAAALRAEAPDLAFDAPETLTALIAGSTAEPRFRSGLVAGFAGVALGLAALGLYGLVSYSVMGRTREIATRLALGATPGAMRDGVLREGLLLTAAGLAVGLGAALGLGRVLQSLLYETTASDPLVLTGLAIVMLAVGALACYLPARRAMRIDPVIALRAD